MHRPAQGLPVLRLVGLARVATERITQGSSADFDSIQTSTGRDLGPEARLREQFESGTQRPRSSSHGRHVLMARRGPELRSFVTQQDLRSWAGLPRYPPRPRRRTSQRIQRITTAGAAGTMTTIGEAIMAAGREAVVGVSTLMIGREVRYVSPTLSSCNCGGSDVNAWSPCPLHLHTSLLSHCLTRVHTHPLSTGK